MKTFLCLVLVIVSFVSHVTIIPRLGLSYTLHPVLHYIGMFIGIGLLAWLMKKKFTILRLAATLFSVILVGFFFWYTAIFSSIDNTRSTIAAGEVAGQSLKQIELSKIDGGNISLGELFKKNKGAIIVFARGAW